MIVVGLVPPDRVELDIPPPRPLSPPSPFGVRNFNEIQLLCVFISAGQTNAGQQYRSGNEIFRASNGHNVSTVVQSVGTLEIHMEIVKFIVKNVKFMTRFDFVIN